LNKQPGVAVAEVNFATATAHVVLAEQPADPETLRATVAKAGYELDLPNPGSGGVDTPVEDDEPRTAI
jgi:cation transport ATPase